MRYFIEVAYRGTNYSGFQAQKNANTIQNEIEKAFKIIQRKDIVLTGSSRTDAGVHAIQNFFHFDFEKKIDSKFLYSINSILPEDIVVKEIFNVKADAHCRFDAESREYKYYIYQKKNPFLKDKAYYYPYKPDLEKLNEAAAVIKKYTDFTSFSKKNTQVRSFICSIHKSEWKQEGDCLIYCVTANRFLRGMVRALVATILQVGLEKITLSEFRKIIEAKDCKQAKFGVPPEGLFLVAVHYPKNSFKK
ncbi:MAG: tRNA pseudouridine(38-40) synthase TruA [Chitinophagaceae bacterium]|nr:MAG: tRNA pseudouridine(38-40) synthase TruA [Chitinophagaceae bacterium]